MTSDTTRTSVRLTEEEKNLICWALGYAKGRLIAEHDENARRTAEKLHQLWPKVSQLETEN